LGPRGLLSLWFQVRVMWLLIWWPLKAYMVINFRTRRISWVTCKLTQTSIYIYIYIYIYLNQWFCFERNVSSLKRKRRACPILYAEATYPTSRQREEEDFYSATLGYVFSFRKWYIQFFSTHFYNKKNYKCNIYITK